MKLIRLFLLVLTFLAIGTLTGSQEDNTDGSNVCECEHSTDKTCVSGEYHELTSDYSPQSDMVVCLESDFDLSDLQIDDPVYSSVDLEYVVTKDCDETCYPISAGTSDATVTHEVTSNPTFDITKAGTYTITVKYEVTSDYGCPVEEDPEDDVFTICVNKLGAIEGKELVCYGETKTYTVEGNCDYPSGLPVWEVHRGTIVGTSTGTSIEVKFDDWDKEDCYATITVKCGDGDEQQLEVDVALVTDIEGPDAVCSDGEFDYKAISCVGEDGFPEDMPEWEITGGKFIVDGSEEDTAEGPEVTVKWDDDNEPGSLTAKCGENDEGFTLDVDKVEADIDVDSNNDGSISGDDDDVEESEAFILFVNDNDSNDDDVIDNSDSTYESSDPQIKNMRALIKPENMGEGRAYIEVSSANKLRIFKDGSELVSPGNTAEVEIPLADVNGSQPLNLKLEGVGHGNVTVKLIYKKEQDDGTTSECIDFVKIKVIDVTLTPDEETHLADAEDLTVFPGDIERLFVEFEPEENDGTYFFKVKSSANAMLFKGNDSSTSQAGDDDFTEKIYYDDLPKDDNNNKYVNVFGIKKGTETKIVLFRENSDGSEEEIDEIVAKIGGEIKITVTGVITFRPSESVISSAAAMPVFTASSGGSDDGIPISLSGTPVRTGPGNNAFNYKGDLISVATNKGLTTAEYYIEVKDANGDAKPGKRIVLKSYHGDFEISAVGAQYTDDDGVFETGVRITGNFELPLNNTITADQIVTFIGRTAELLDDSTNGLQVLGDEALEKIGMKSDDLDLENWKVDSDVTEFFISKRKFTGEDSIFEDEFSTAPTMRFLTSKSIPAVAMNNVAYRGMEKWIDGDGYQRNEFEELIGAHDGVAMPAPESYTFVLKDPASRKAIFDNIDDEAQDDVTLEGNGDNLKYAALAGEIAFEIAKALTPGADALDIWDAYVWGPLARGDDPDHITGVLSTVGLLLDCGHIIPGAGSFGSIAANYAVGMTRALFKLLKKIPKGDDIVKALIKSEDSITASCKLLFKYFDKMRDAGGTATQTVAKIYTQWDKLAQNTLDFTAQSIVDGITIIGKKATRGYSDKAAEGMTILMKKVESHSRKAAVEGLYDRYTDDVIEASLEVIGNFRAGDKALDITKFSDEAVDGITKFIKYSDGNLDDVKAIAQKILEIDPDDISKADKVFARISSFSGSADELNASMKGVKDLLNVANDGPDNLYKFMNNVAEANKVELQTAFKNLSEFDDIDNVAKFSKLIDDYSGQGIVNTMDDLALTMSNSRYLNPPNPVYESLVSSIDFIKLNGAPPSGFLTKPQGSGTSSMGTDLRKGNLGHAFEPHATKNLINSGEFAKNQIIEVGRRFDVVVNGKPRTIEADILVTKNGKTIFYDFKKSNGKILEDAIKGIEEALELGTYFDEAVYALQKGTMDRQKYIDMITTSNVRLAAKNLPLIRIVNAGDFQ